MESEQKSKTSRRGNVCSRHPVLANFLIIIVVAVIGIWIAYLWTAIFTRHGESDKVPSVEKMSYTQAIGILHDNGFKVDIRDSVYNDKVKPGFVIEQFPKPNSTVKPGRKIFLYINAVHPKEVVIDDDNHPREDALKSFSFRSGMARLEELGFKNIKVVEVLGDNDCIVKVTANGRTVKKTEKVPVNAAIVVEVYDGRLGALRDSLQTAEYMEYAMQERGLQQEAENNIEEPAPAPKPKPRPKPEPTPELTEEEETDNYLNQ